jgi:hypothetical protein
MKNLVVLFITVALMSCQQPAKEVVPQIIKEGVPQIIGYDITEGVKTPIYGGDLSTVEVWEKYIKAHNAKDLETIQNLNAEQKFEIKTAQGRVFKSSEDYINFLKNLLESSANPKWTTKFLIANAFTTEEGVVKQYVTSGHNLSVLEEGDTLKIFQVFDALIVNGKVQNFTITDRIATE